MEQVKGAKALKNKRHEAFCHELLASEKYSITEAGNKTGFKNRQNAWEVHEREDVQDRIAYLKAKREERTKIDADYVLKRLVEIDQMDVLDIMDENLNMKPLKEWPKIWRQYINNIESIELSDGEGWLKKIKWPDKVKNLELIGKHVSVGAFKENIKHEHSGSLNISFSVEFGDGENQR